ncbi:MAG: hypothetical protein PHR26_01815 [Candidatus ainarchaeum sp.]|nr:hypothetical protein [Candidatus ainarchaeum sp.]MDD3975730.1 hypothetical protein [Candidatus ainarchaeum sp.]
MKYIKVRGFLLVRNSLITINIMVNSFNRICNILNINLNHINYKKNDLEHEIYISEYLYNLLENHNFEFDFLKFKLINIRKKIFNNLKSKDVNFIYNLLIDYEAYQILIFEKYKSKLLDKSVNFKFINIFYFYNNFRYLFENFILSYPNEKYNFINIFLNYVDSNKVIDDYISKDIADVDFLKYISNEEDFVLGLIYVYLKLNDFKVI